MMTSGSNKRLVAYYRIVTLSPFLALRLLLSVESITYSSICSIVVAILPDLAWAYKIRLWRTTDPHKKAPRISPAILRYTLFLVTCNTSSYPNMSPDCESNFGMITDPSFYLRSRPSLDDPSAILLASVYQSTLRLPQRQCYLSFHPHLSFWYGDNVTRRSSGSSQTVQLWVANTSFPNIPRTIVLVMGLFVIQWPTNSQGISYPPKAWGFGGGSDYPSSTLFHQYTTKVSSKGAHT